MPLQPTPSRPVILLILLFTLAAPLPLAGSEAPLVAAASGMQFALREIAKSFTAETGIEIRLTLASSGKLYRQIENNAPFEIFLSADPALIRSPGRTPRVRPTRRAPRERVTPA